MARAYSERIKQKARSLRQRGWTLGEIGLKLNIPKNTISGWLKDIQLTRKQQNRIKDKIIASAAIGRPLASKLMRDKIEKWKNDIRTQVKHFGKLPSQNQEVGKLICGIMYLCEGSKYPSSQAMTFSNSDPKVIAAFLNLLRKYFHIHEDKLRCRIMPRWDQNINKLQRFWSKITKIPLRYFYKTKADGRTKGIKTMRKNYMGICALTYCDTSLQFELQAIGERIIESGAYWRKLEPVSSTHR
jgi:transcriptional regulator with XRE-family HTH domain